MSGIIGGAGSKSGVIGKLGTQAGTCSFLATNTSSSWVTLADEDVCGFSDASTGEGHDDDGCYDTGNDKFTAPASGVYHFWFSIYTAYTSSTNGFHFSKNGTELALTNDASVKFTWHQHTADDFIINASITIPLASSDYIQITANTACHYNTGHSCWGGCRLR